MLGFDAALIIPSLKICGNKIYGIAQEHDMIVQTESSGVCYKFDV